MKKYAKKCTLQWINEQLIDHQFGRLRQIEHHAVGGTLSS